MPTYEWNSNTGHYVPTGGIARDTARSKRNASGGIDPWRFKGGGSHEDDQGRGVARRNAVSGVKPGPSKQALQDAWDAFHPDTGATQTTAGVARPDYDAMFRQSLDRQRASIDATLRSVLGDIDVRRQQGQQIVGMLPGEVNALYDQGKKAVSDQSAAAMKSLAQAGAAAPGAAQQAGLAAIQSAMEQSRTAGLADAPYLTIGANDLFNRQRGAAQQAAQMANSELDNTLADYYAGRAQQQASFDNDLYLYGLQADAESAARQDDELRQALLARASTRPGTARWWQANAMVDPEGAERMANADINPDTIENWRKNPDAWKEARKRFTPQMTAFLRFAYGLK